MNRCRTNTPKSISFSFFLFISRYCGLSLMSMSCLLRILSHSQWIIPVFVVFQISYVAKRFSLECNKCFALKWYALVSRSAARVSLTRVFLVRRVMEFHLIPRGKPLSSPIRMNTILALSTYVHRPNIQFESNGACSIVSSSATLATAIRCCKLSTSASRSENAS